MIRIVTRGYKMVDERRVGQVMACKLEGDREGRHESVGGDVVSGKHALILVDELRVEVCSVRD